MGLIGYVNDETQRRSKEIAIRKVNGAEASHILGLLTRDILYVSVISILVGTTVSYFAGQAWLDQFAEQIDLNPLLFAATALFVQLLIVICVVLKHGISRTRIRSIALKQNKPNRIKWQNRADTALFCYYRMLFGNLLDVNHQTDNGRNKRQRIRYRHTDPDSFQSPPVREQ